MRPWHRCRITSRVDARLSCLLFFFFDENPSEYRADRLFSCASSLRIESVYSFATALTSSVPEAVSSYCPLILFRRVFFQQADPNGWLKPSWIDLLTVTVYRTRVLLAKVGLEGELSQGGTRISAFEQFPSEILKEYSESCQFRSRSCISDKGASC